MFGPVVDRYPMEQSGADGPTVRLAYEPRLARVMLSHAEVQRSADYYARCAEEGSTPEQIEESARAMVRMRAILAHPDRIARLARDMVLHYEALCAEKPAVVQKAMIVCADRAIAFAVLQEIGRIRPDWTVSRRAAEEGALTPPELARPSPRPHAAARPRALATARPGWRTHLTPRPLPPPAVPAGRRRLRGPWRQPPRRRAGPRAAWSWPRPRPSQSLRCRRT